MNIQSIQQALAPLVGLPLRCIGRASNLVWLHFGELHEISDRQGGTKVVGDWAVHIGCPWRLVRHGRILVGYHDFYYTPNGDALEDWDVVGKTRFDFIASTLCGEFARTPPLVVAVQPDDVGGFCVRLGDDYRVDVFPDESDETCEHWRIFQPGVGSKHFVFQGSTCRGNRASRKISATFLATSPVKRGVSVCHVLGIIIHHYVPLESH